MLCHSRQLLALQARALGQGMLALVHGMLGTLHKALLGVEYADPICTPEADFYPGRTITGEYATCIH